MISRDCISRIPKTRVPKANWLLIHTQMKMEQKIIPSCNHRIWIWHWKNFKTLFLSIHFYSSVFFDLLLKLWHLHFSRVFFPFFSHNEEERAGLRYGWDLDSDRVLGISVFGNPISDVT
jgi:hypothetical protein